MKIRCWDKYNKHWLIIEPDDDQISCNAWSSHSARGDVALRFTCDLKQEEYCEDPHPERWSDLERFEVLNED